MDTVDKLAEALAKAQATITCPSRNREVTVRTKTGGSYEFRYSTLDHIIEHVRKPLTDNGLWFSQILEGNEAGKYQLVTRLMHSSGQYIESKTPLLVQGADNQQFGSALTYMRRYSLAAMLGLSADEDDDANSADGNTIEPKKKPKKEIPPTIIPGIEDWQAKILECASCDKLDSVKGKVPKQFLADLAESISNRRFELCLLGIKKAKESGDEKLSKNILAYIEKFKDKSIGRESWTDQQIEVLGKAMFS
jgi:hypothetical protein